jgi:hypothetical protein
VRHAELATAHIESSAEVRDLAEGSQEQARRQYIHLVRAMRAGDALYLPDRKGDLDRQLVSAVGRSGGRVSTSKFVAIATGPETAHWVLKVTMHEPLKQGVRTNAR